MVFKNPFDRTVTGVFYCLLFLFVSNPVNADLFLTTNQNPFSLINGLPLPAIAVLPQEDESSYSLSAEITNTLNSESNAQESVLLDFEAYHLKASFTSGLGDGWAYKIHIPLLYRGGGIFDNAIDRWHEFFGLPRAERPNVANNQYRIQYIQSGSTLIDISQPSNQIGDIQLSLGKQLVNSRQLNISLWSTIELPTGDASNLSGNKGIDYSLTLATNKQLSSNWQLLSNIGILLPGDSFNSALATQSQVVFGYLAIAWSASPTVELQVQLNGHSDFYKDTNLRLLSGTYELLFGGSYRLSACTNIDVVFSEDIKVGAAPDISLMVSWRSQLGDCTP